MQTAELLRKVRRLEIRSRHLVEDLFAGQSESVFKGRGMEFAEVREYQPGDDARTIDWNVTARMGAPYVKKFVEERDLTLLILVDVSGSQAFGSEFLLKRDYAAELAAVLAFSAVANHDRVGAVLFSDRVEAYVPPGRGRDHALRIVRDLLALEPRGQGTDLAGVLRFARGVLRRRGALGRSRVDDASRRAASLSIPRVCRVFANCTIRMPFLAINPTRVISPRITQAGRVCDP